MQNSMQWHYAEKRTLEFDNENVDGTNLMNTALTDCLSQQSAVSSCKYCGQTSGHSAFCSLTCSHAYLKLNQRRSSAPIKTGKGSKGLPGKLKKCRSIRQQRKSLSDCHTETCAFDWGNYFSENSASAAAVSSFAHCAFAEVWDGIDVGVKVEVEHRDCLPDRTVYWIANIVRLAGYRALLRYEGCEEDASLDFWLSLVVGRVHRVGWAAATGHKLVAPFAVRWRRNDWKDYLVERLTGARTLPASLDDAESSGSVKGLSQSARCLPSDARVEVIDKTCISATCTAVVEDVVGGRLHLRYEHSKNDEEFWCHIWSSLVHPLGWSQKVGHRQNLIADEAKDHQQQQTSDVQVTEDMFVQVKKTREEEEQEEDASCFMPGMKLEAIDPLNLSTICVATVTRVLKDGYLMVGIDGSIASNGSDWFCYHSSSPCIFPAGFCKVNNLQLTPPRGYPDVFDWCTYLRETNSIAAPVCLFDQEIPRHGFRAGMKLEAADLMDPKLICVATVALVVGRLLRIHFDSWDSSYDQWLDCRSPDIYPVGWCELVGHRLEPPPPTYICTNSGFSPYNGLRLNKFHEIAVKRRKQKTEAGRLLHQHDRKKMANGIHQVNSRRWLAIDGRSNGLSTALINKQLTNKLQADQKVSQRSLQSVGRQQLPQQQHYQQPGVYSSLLGASVRPVASSVDTASLAASLPNITMMLGRQSVNTENISQLLQTIPFRNYGSEILQPQNKQEMVTLSGNVAGNTFIKQSSKPPEAEYQSVIVRPTQIVSASNVSVKGPPTLKSH